MVVEELIIWLVIGAVAGWIAGKIGSGNGFSLISNVVAGIVGAAVGGWLLPRLGILPGGIAGTVITAIIGAASLLLLLEIPRRSLSGARTIESHKLPIDASSPLPADSRRPRQSTGRKIFVSYRRDDSLDVTGRIYDRLIREYGEKAVFRDMDSIPLGIDFRQHIDKFISECDACVVVIGNKWLTVVDKTGQRRIDDPRDHVRIEIESALKRNVPVVPLLVGGADMPGTENLPASLQDLAFRHGTQIRPDPDFHRDVDRLVTGLRGA